MLTVGSWGYDVILSLLRGLSRVPIYLSGESICPALEPVNFDLRAGLFYRFSVRTVDDRSDEVEI